MQNLKVKKLKVKLFELSPPKYFRKSFVRMHIGLFEKCRRLLEELTYLQNLKVKKLKVKLFELTTPKYFRKSFVRMLHFELYLQPYLK